MTIVMAPIVVLLITLLQVFQLTAAQGVDRTLQTEQSGSDVVRAVVSRINAVFGNDNQFLRRIAYVESKDGTDTNTYRAGYHGGIWQVDEVGFLDTQNTTSHPGLIAKYNEIGKAFGIDWKDVKWNDLRKPLYSGIAARLFLSNIPEAIPCDLAEQAAYWKRYYNTEAGNGTVEKFIDDVQALGRTESCGVNSDIFFVLDASGSIGRRNFDRAKQFILQFVNDLTIGPEDTRVGVIRFESTAEVLFDLNTYRDNTSLRQAVLNIGYTRRGTNIPAALCQLIRAYSGSSGAREDTSSVFRLAILMTDGQSFENKNECNFTSVAEAARAVHAVSPPILVFAFGVGDDYNEQDVIDIASGPQFIDSAQSFDTSHLACVQSTQEDAICHSISTPVKPGAANQGSLDQGEQIRWQIDAPKEGINCSLWVDEGTVAFYASTEISSPNKAFHQWRIQTSSSENIFIRSMIQHEYGNNSSLAQNNSNEMVPVYTALFGLDANNTFTLQCDTATPVNDTVIGDPLFTVPIHVSSEDLKKVGAGIEKLSLCYEIHGNRDTIYNMVTDECASVNAHYQNLTSSLNVIDEVGVRATDDNGRCKNIQVNVKGCFASIDGVPIDTRFSSWGISVRKYSNRVRIMVPNCAELSLVMWVICEQRKIDNPFVEGNTVMGDMIKLVVMRGLNIGHREAHGLIGQFWNIPVSVTPFTGVDKNGHQVTETFVVNTTSRGTSHRYTGRLYGLTWEQEKTPCLYVGSRQGGMIDEIRSPNDAIIDGEYTNYAVPSLFSEEKYTFGLFDEGNCAEDEGSTTIQPQTTT